MKSLHESLFDSNLVKRKIAFTAYEILENHIVDVKKSNGIFDKKPKNRNKTSDINIEYWINDNELDKLWKDMKRPLLKYNGFSEEENKLISCILKNIVIDKNFEHLGDQTWIKKHRVMTDNSGDALPGVINTYFITPGKKTSWVTKNFNTNNLSKYCEIELSIILFRTYSNVYYNYQICTDFNSWSELTTILNN